MKEAPTAMLTIEAGRTETQYWRDLWVYRELMYFLAWRDLSVRYKQTALGVAWAVIRPALAMLVFVGFRRLAHLPASSVPEPILVFSAVLPWQFFASALSDTSSSLLGNSNLIAKVYFPRLLIPLASAVTSLVDFVIMFIMLLILLLIFRFAPSGYLVFLPIFIIADVALAVSFGLFFAALNVSYRDFKYIIPFVIQMGVFVSPVAFTSSSIPAQWRLLFNLNPLVGIIEGFRWCIIAQTPPEPLALLSTCAWTLLLGGAGLWYFRRTERQFADFI